MSDRTVGVSELIQRLKHDGIAAGHAQAEKLLKDAQEKALQLVEQAKKEAKEKLSAADVELVKKKAHLDAELKMAARDFLLKFRNNLKERIINTEIEDSVRMQLEDISFMRNNLESIINEYIKSDACHLELVVSPPMREKMESYFKGKLASKMRDGSLIEWKEQNDMVGFRLQVTNKNFTWDFSSEAITQEIAKLIDKDLVSYLMGEEESHNG